MIRNFRESDEKELVEICLGQSSMDDSFKEAIKNVYCLYYVKYEPDGIFVETDEDDRAIGYVVSSKDYMTYRDNLLEFVSDMDEMTKAIAIGTLNALDKFKKEYPAHLHINISEKHRSKGIGSRLIARLMKYLMENKIEGLMLNVGIDNKKARAFYERNGFSILEEAEYEIAMGITLSHSYETGKGREKAL